MTGKGIWLGISSGSILRTGLGPENIRVRVGVKDMVRVRIRLRLRIRIRIRIRLRLRRRVGEDYQ